MRFFRLRPIVVFGSAFYLCAVIASFFAPIYSLVFAAIFALILAIELLLLKKPSDIEKKQTKLALVSLLLAPVLSLSLSAFREYRAGGAVERGREIAFAGTVRERIWSSSGYAAYLIDVSEADGESASFAAALFCGDLSFAPGDAFEAAGTFGAIGESFPEGARYLRSRGAVAECEAESVKLVGFDRSPIYRAAALRERIAAKISLYVPQNASLISALTVGKRDGLDPALRRSFSELGVSHLLAISGVHMSVIFSAVAFLARPFGRKRFFILLPAIVGYEALTGFCASTVRAGTMLAIVAFAGTLGIMTDRASVISLALVLITVFSPGAVWDVGLLLSALSVFALAVLPSPERKKDRGRLKTALVFVGASLGASAAVSVVTLPVTAREYGAVSLAAPVANLVFIPAVTVILFFAPVFLLSTLFPAIAVPLGSALDLYSEFVRRLAKALGGGGRYLVSLEYPFFGVLTVLLAVSFVCACVSRRRRAPILLTAAIASCMVISGAATEALRSGETRVEAFAEAAGDIVAVTDSSSFYVVDSAKGSSSLIRRIEDEVRKNMTTGIGKYVFTHYHADSDVYLQKLLDKVRVAEIVLPDAANEDERSLCMRMANIALGSGVRPTIADGESALGAARLALSERCDVPNSVESSFAMTVSLGENAVTYVTSGYFDAPEAFRESADGILAEKIVVGTHGAAAKSPPPDGAVGLCDGGFSAVWKKD